jgi:adenylate kinase family enzyme
MMQHSATQERSMRRVSVVGNSGSGKTTFARDLAGRLGVPHTELDSVFHQPGWTPLPPDEFRAAIGEVAARDAWVVDGNYREVRELLWHRADTVVFMDLPRHEVLSQLVPRTLRRLVMREELWNGNREELHNLLSRDPEQSIILWSVTQHRKYRRRYVTAMHDPRWSHIGWVHLDSRRHADWWLSQWSRSGLSRTPA